MENQQTKLLSDSLAKTFKDGGVVSLGGQDSQGFLVCFLLTVRTRGLMIGAYSAYQTELSNSIIELRDLQHLTFKQIADHLIAQGYSSPRGFELGAESVFSVYKKRKIRDERLNAKPEVLLSDIAAFIPTLAGSQRCCHICNKI